MGRVFARKFGVCGNALPDFELSWLRVQHELATQVFSALGADAKRGAARFSSLTIFARPTRGQALIRVSNKGFGFAPPVVLLLRGDDPGLARRMPKHGTTGIQPSARSTYGPKCIVASEGFGRAIAPEKPH
jgi:hypothetical protein